MSTDTTETAVTEAHAVEIPATYYFYFISAKFSRKLDEPKVSFTDIDGGYSRTVTTHETGESFNAGTMGFPVSETVGKFDILSKAMELAVENINKSRRAKGETLMFRAQDMLVTGFDAGRNAL